MAALISGDPFVIIMSSSSPAARFLIDAAPAVMVRDTPTGPGGVGGGGVHSRAGGGSGSSFTPGNQGVALYLRESYPLL
jgi:hypothetical protein